MRPLLALLTSVLSLALASAAQAQADGRKAYLGLAVHSTSNEYWNQEIQGGRMFAASLPAGAIETQILVSEGDDERQLAGIKAFVADHGRDAILYVDPSNASNTPAIAEFCEESGVFWTSVWHLAAGLDPRDFQYYVMHQSVDGVKQGRDIAVKMFQEFKTPGRGRILALKGPPGNDSALERFKGLEQALSEYDVELLETQVCDWNPQLAFEAVSGWLEKFKDIDGIWSANDGMALAAIQALKARGMNGQVKVVGVDGISAALKAIEEGDLVCTVANNGFLQGGYGAAYVYKAWAGEIKPAGLPDRQRAFYTDGFMVDKDNLEKFRRDFISAQPVYDFDNLDFPISRSLDLDLKRTEGLPVHQ